MRETLIGRTLAAALLAGALTLAWLQSRSPLSQALSEGRPVLGWLQLDGPSPAPAVGKSVRPAPAELPIPQALFLAVYQPFRRTLDLVYLPRSASVAAAGAQLAALAPAAGISAGLPVWSAAQPGLSAEPPLDAADWIARRVHEPRSWLRAFSPSSGPAWSWFDRLALALELQRLGPEDLRPAWLPPDVQAAGLLNRLILGTDALPAPDRITVEVLNASPKPGIASRAKNILRLKGADVMSVGNIGGHERTLVYDRTGRFENAASVRRMLGCPAARALTQVDVKRLVDVSVVLAEDCPLPQGG